MKSVKATPAQQFAHEFDPAELERRFHSRLAIYLSTIETPREMGGMVLVSEQNPTHFLMTVSDMALKGYELSTRVSINCTHPHYDCAFDKPEALVDADIVIIKEQVAAQYTADRKALYAAHVKAVAQETLQRQATEARKKAEQVQAKAEAAALAEAESVVGQFA